jgi:N-acetylglutamate synthase-like GNAT family acetyltransferase
MFYFPISHQDIAKQIAELINSYNSLAMVRTSQGILNGKTKYVVETHGKYVIGLAGIEKVSYQLSELKHMVVHPDWRSKGLGSFVAKRALQICDTPSVYATVRTANEASIRTLEKLEFLKTHEFSAGDHDLAMLIRVAPKCVTNTTPKWNSCPETEWMTPMQVLPDSFTKPE